MGTHERTEIKLTARACAQLGNPKMAEKRLISAVMSADVDTVEILISGGVPIDAVDGDNRTSLHHAVAIGNEKIIDMLILGGAKLMCVDDFGLTPLGEVAIFQSLMAPNRGLALGAASMLANAFNR